MNYVVSIADRNYVKYTDILFRSVRTAGWEGPCILFTNEDNIYSSEKVVKLDFKSKSNIFDDPRWMFFDIFDYFDKKDKVMHFDADCEIDKNFPFQKLFQKETVSAFKRPNSFYDNETICAIKELTGHMWPFLMVAAPFMLTINKKNIRYMDNAHMGIICSIYHGSGLITAMQTAYIYDRQFKINHWVTPSRVRYTKDRCSKPLSYMRHYGGSQGKREWEGKYGH